MPGAIAEFSLSKNGQALVVATNPDPDIPGSAHQYLLSHYQIKENKRANGNESNQPISQRKSKNKRETRIGRDIERRVHLDWQLPVRTSIRGLDLSEDGSLTVATTYENEIFAVNSKGKLLWSIEGICKPMILNSSQQILCYHDDDAEPRIAFDLLDWKGKKRLSFPIENDILTLKVATHEKRILLGLENGKILLLDQELKPLWTQTVAGEIVDLALSNEKNPSVAVLYQPKNRASITKGIPQKQEISVLDSDGHFLGSSPSLFYSSQIEFSTQAASKNFIYAYGNSSDGQAVGKIEISADSSKKGKELWRYRESTEAEYLSSILGVTEAETPSHEHSIEIIMGVEQATSYTRESHLVALAPEGKIQWDLKLPSDEGAYLNGLRTDSNSSLLAASTDDGKMNLVRIDSPSELPPD